MNKVLEALNRLAFENACCRCEYYINNKCENKDKCVWLTIKQSLQRLEAIDNKQLKDKDYCSITNDEVVPILHNIETGNFIKCDICDTKWHEGCMCCRKHLKNSEEFEIIKQALLKAQEQEKVLEIIKEKRVNSYYFDIASDVKIYNNWIVILYGYPKEFLLTQEEFDLLKRWADE